MTWKRAVVVAAIVVVVAAGLAFVLLRDSDDGIPFCTQLNDIYRADSQAGQINLDDAVATDEQLTAFRDRFASLEAAAPDDVEEDVAVIAEFGAGLAQAALDHLVEDGLERRAALAAVTEQAGDVAGASQRLEAYRAASC